MKFFRTSFTGIYLSAVSVLLVASVIFGLYQHRDKQKYKNTLNGLYEGKLISVSAYMEDINSLLNKLDALSPGDRAPVYAELWKQAYSAHECLGDLPYSPSVVASSLKYLAQLGDFSKEMLKNPEYGMPSSEEDGTLKSLREYAATYSAGLARIASQFTSGSGINWELLSAEEDGGSETQTGFSFTPSSLLGSMLQVTDDFRSYPSIIYDGQFSDHVQKSRPVMTNGKPEIGEREAEASLLGFFGSDRVESVTLLGETPQDAGVTPVYSFELRLKGEKNNAVFADVTKKGGYVLWMLDSSEAKQRTGVSCSADEAIAIAERFLSDRGFPNMRKTAYEQSDGSIIINFAGYEKGIIMYPDLIKLKVSLSGGEITGFDARGYISYHRKRTFPEDTLPVGEAGLSLESGLHVTSYSTCVIPLSDGSEAFCYEFVCEKNGSGFLIYVNAVTGKTENILEQKVNEFGISAE